MQETGSKKWSFEENKTLSSAQRNETVLQCYDKASYDVRMYHMVFMLIREL